MSRPQQSKGKRVPLRDKMAALEPQYGYCPDCGDAIHNRGAHAEACRGTQTAQWNRRFVYGPSGTLRRCQARIPTGRGLWTYCVKPWNHEGGHIYGD